MEIKIGILLPRSDMFPALSLDFLNGLKLSLSNLKDKNIDSPRGELTYYNYNESEISDFKLRKFNYNKIKYHNTVIETLEMTISDKTYQKFEDLPLSGWKNLYICT